MPLLDTFDAFLLKELVNRLLSYSYSLFHFHLQKASPVSPPRKAGEVMHVVIQYEYITK